MATDIKLEYDTARNIAIDFLKQCRIDCLENQEAIKEDFRNGEMVSIQLADYADAADNLKHLAETLRYLGVHVE